MALTEQQKKELNIAQTRINQGKGTDADIANVNYAKANLGFGADTTSNIEPTQNQTTNQVITPVTGDVSGLNTFIPTPGPTQAEATQQAIGSDQFKEQKGFITEEQRLATEALQAQRGQTQQSFTRTREDTIRAFQDALDSINRQAKQVGIGVRAGSSRRQLFNASGELSGIGQGVAATAIEPITTATRKLAERQGIALSRLTENEANQLATIDRQLEALPLKSKKQIATLRDQIVQGIFDTAKARQEQELEIFKENRTLQNQLRDDIRAADKLLMDKQLKDPTSRVNILKIRQIQQSKGRKYISTPAERDALKAQGFDVIQIGNDFFTLSAKEQSDLNKSRARSANGGSPVSSEFADDLNNARAIISAGGDANSVMSELFAKYPKNSTAIKNGLSNAGYSLEFDKDTGGIKAFGPNNIPITPKAYSLATGTPLSEVFGRSTLPEDIALAEGFKDEEDNISELERLLRGVQ